MKDYFNLRREKSANKREQRRTGSSFAEQKQLSWPASKLLLFALLAMLVGGVSSAWELS